ncbi:MAG: hypothetical protein ACIAQ0_05500 [Phycisphaerales bacterium JB058]
MRLRWLLVLVPCILVGVAVMMMGPWFDVVEAFKPGQPFEMKPAQSSEAASRALGGLSEAARGQYRSAQMWDAPFALANAAALLVLLMVPARLIWRRSKLVWIFALMPMAVVVGEAMENLGILSMLSSFEASGEADPALATLGTGLKFMGFMPAMACVVVLWVVAVIACVRRGAKGKRADA